MQARANRLIVTAALAGLGVVSLLPEAQAVNRTWIATEAGADLTTTTNRSAAGAVGTADQGFFRQGAASGGGTLATASMTVSGLMTPQRLTFQNTVPVTISGLGTN